MAVTVAFSLEFRLLMHFSSISCLTHVLFMTTLHLPYSNADTTSITHWLKHKSTRVILIPRHGDNTLCLILRMLSHLCASVKCLAPRTEQVVCATENRFVKFWRDDLQTSYCERKRRRARVCEALVGADIASECEKRLRKEQPARKASHVRVLEADDD